MKITLPSHLRVFALISTLVLILGIGACAPSTHVDGQNGQAQPQETYIENKGSDTIVNLALAWAEAYQNMHSNVRISVTGGGSGTGISSLINNTVDLANASRQIKPEEIENARAGARLLPPPPWQRLPVR